VVVVKSFLHYLIFMFKVYFSFCRKKHRAKTTKGSSDSGYVAEDSPL